MIVPPPKNGRNATRPDSEVYSSNSGAPQEHASDNGATTESQVEKFERFAREAGADASEDHFKARLRKIAKAKIEEQPSRTPTKKGED